MTRIAVVASVDLSARSGVARNLAQLLAALRRAGHEVLRVAADERPPVGPDAAARAGARLRQQAAECERLFRSWRPEVVHVEVASAFGHAAAAAAARLGMPVTCFWHPLDVAVPETSRGDVRMRLIAFHRAARRTFVESTADADMLRASGVPDVIELARGVDTDRFSPTARSPALREAWGAEADDPVLLHVGRLIALKNLDLLVRTAVAARAAVPRLRLVVVGEGPETPRLRGLLPWATFTGALGEDTLAEVYASADLFAFPSQVDAFGNVVIEAMAAGLAVVAFDRASAARYVRDGSNGRAIPPGSDAAFVDAGIALASDLVLTRRLGAAARAGCAAFALDQAVAAMTRELTAAAARS
jgi:glycosyltransferase involved in cell wall biosynthesis